MSMSAATNVRNESTGEIEWLARKLLALYRRKDWPHGHRLATSPNQDCQLLGPTRSAPCVTRWPWIVAIPGHPAEVKLGLGASSRTEWPERPGRGGLIHNWVC